MTFTDLAAGQYIFLLMDEFWDGICCQFGNGNIKIYEVFPPESGRADVLGARWEVSLSIDLVPFSLMRVCSQTETPIFADSFVILTYMQTAYLQVLERSGRCFHGYRRRSAILFFDQLYGS